jgi:hypothetical protein
MTALLCVLGVMLNGYPERTLLSILSATTAVSFLVIGAAISEEEGCSWQRWLLFAIVLQVTYAVGQMVYLSKGPGWELFTVFHQWDLSSVGLSTFIQARSSGLYLNPNELGFWAASAAVLSWQLLRGRVQILGFGLAVVTVLLSQSRGAIIALVAAFVVGGALTIGRGRMSTASVAKAAISAILIVIAAVCVTLLLAPQTNILSRFGALWEVVSQGPAADANLAGRIDYWTAVVGLSARYPWGTLGPVQFLLGSSVDSSWFAAFAQGSVLYLVCLVMLIATGLSLPSSRQGDTLRLLTVVVAVASISQAPLGYPAIVIFWLLLGASLSWSVRRRRVPILGNPRSGRQQSRVPPMAGASERRCRALDDA